MLTHMRGQGTAALHIGGFLGPFGGAVLAVLLPELQHDFHASRDAVALAIPFYLVPFAALQLGSGFVGARFGIGKTVRLGYIAYALASLATAIVPNLEGFLAARFVQGCANAFITPLLLATLGEIVPKARAKALYQLRRERYFWHQNCATSAKLLCAGDGAKVHFGFS